jgi:MerR family redox-sensitive transcriptional activator SoxR
MTDMTIGEVARRTGLRTSTIRYYESIAVLPAPHRAGGQRRYDPSVLDHLIFIQITQRLGFSLDEIKVLFHRGSHDANDPAFSELWHTLARQKLDDVNRLIEHANHVKGKLVEGLGCDCPDLGECMDCVRARCQ